MDIFQDTYECMCLLVYVIGLTEFVLLVKLLSQREMEVFWGVFFWNFQQNENGIEI